MERLIIVAATLALLGVGCGNKESLPAPNQPPTETQEDISLDETETTTETESIVRSNQPISFDNSQSPAIVERSLLLTRNLFTAETLAATSAECGTNLAAEHFAEVLQRFSYQRGHRYNFLYRGNPSEPKDYTITAVANEPGYKTMEDFNNDFKVCSVGRDLHPLDLNQNWLIFESDCGDAEDSGCKEIRTHLVETLQIN